MPFLPGFNSLPSPQYSRMSIRMPERHLRTVTRLFLDNSKKTSSSAFLEGDEGGFVVDWEEGGLGDSCGLEERVLIASAGFIWGGFFVRGGNGVLAELWLGRHANNEIRRLGNMNSRTRHQKPPHLFVSGFCRRGRASCYHSQ